MSRTGTGDFQEEPGVLSHGVLGWCLGGVQSKVGAVLWSGWEGWRCRVGLKGYFLCVFFSACFQTCHYLPTTSGFLFGVPIPNHPAGSQAFLPGTSPTHLEAEEGDHKHEERKA